MKTIFNYYFLVALLIVTNFFISCQKDIDQQISDNSEGIKVLSYSNPNRRNGVTEILDFPDMESFRKKVRELEELAEMHDIAFIEKYKDLTEEEINEMDSITGFNYYEPLLEFNRALGFNSLLDNYIEKEKDWMNQEDLLIDQDPDVLFRFLNDGELTLLNDDWAVKVGGKIMVYKKDGKIDITSGSLETLVSIASYEKIEDMDLSQFNDLVTTMLPSNSVSSCVNSVHNVNYYDIDGSSNKRMKAKIRLSSNDYWTGSEIYVKTKSLKKVLGVWIWHRVYIKAGLDGYFDAAFPPQDQYICGLNQNSLDENLNKNSKSKGYTVNYSVQLNPALVINVAQGRLKGVHKASNTLKYQNYY